MRKSFFGLLAIGLIGCTQQSKKTNTPKKFSIVPGTESGITFRNDVDDLGKHTPYNTYYIYNGGGVAVGDIDNDYLLDVLLSSNQNGCKLYRNLGEFKFEDITENSKIEYPESWTTGLSMVDLNADGLLDIYICRSGLKEDTTRGNLVFINNGDLTFTEQSLEIGLHDQGTSNQAYFFDFDQDDDLDALVLNHPVDFENAYYPNARISEFRDSIFSNRFYINNNGKFEAANNLFGVKTDKGFSLSASVGDINNDGFPDVYIANDFISPDQFFINQGGNGFVDMADSIFDKTTLFSMGSDMADINNDGLLDLFVADMDPADHFRRKNNKIRFDKTYYDLMDRKLTTPQLSRNMLFLGAETGFKEVGYHANVSSTDWSWATLLEDLDNDGNKDLFITNGTKRDFHDMDYVTLTFGGDMITAQKRHDALGLIKNMPVSPLPNYCFRNTGGTVMEDVSRDWGLDNRINGQAAIIADLDNDGALDVIVNNTDSEASVYRNSNPKDGHFVQFNFQFKNANLVGIGTKMELWSNGHYQVKTLYTNRGYQSSSPPILHFGIGSATSIDSIRVEWPNGEILVEYQPSIDTKHGIGYTSGGALASIEDNLKLLVHASTIPSILHAENDFDETQRDKIVPFLSSQSGPALAMADFNSDGIDDLIIGGATGHSTKVFYQDQNGEFKQSSALFAESVGRENTAILPFDVDGDGDLDLYLGHGGNESIQVPDYLQDLVYENDGNGNFQLYRHQPTIQINTSCLVLLDIDEDGNDDIYVGGGFEPGKYGISQGSKLLQNTTGRLQDITENFPDLESIGCVNDAVLSDIENDGTMGLIVAGHWNSVRRFEFRSGGLWEVDPVFAATGMWNTLSISDLNGDGFEDLIAGNKGLNTVFKASVNEPMNLYVNDLDENGSLDPIVTHFINGTEATFVDKMEFCEKLPQFNNRFLTNRSFAESDLKTIIGSANSSNPKLKIEELRTVALLNDGKGNFTETNLPEEVQMSPVNAINHKDLAGDGIPETLLFGNSNAEFYDQGDITSNHGIILKWVKGEELVMLPENLTGLNISGVVNSSVVNESNSGWSILLGRNDDSLMRIEPAQ